MTPSQDIGDSIVCRVAVSNSNTYKAGTQIEAASTSSTAESVPISTLAIATGCPSIETHVQELAMEAATKNSPVLTITPVAQMCDLWPSTEWEEAKRSVREALAGAFCPGEGDAQQDESAIWAAKRRLLLELLGELDEDLTVESIVQHFVSDDLRPHK